MVRFLQRHNLAITKEQIDLDMPWIEGVPGRGFYSDVFAKAEKSAHLRFRVENIRNWTDGYDYPVRKAVSWWIGELTHIVLLLEWLSENCPKEGAWKIYGVPADVVWLLNTQMKHGAYESLHVSRPWLALMNGFVAISVILFGAFWLTIRSRLKVRPKRYRLAADGRAPYDRPLLESLVDEPGDLIIFHRNRDLACAETWLDWKSCRNTDGRKALSDLPGAVWELVRDCTVLWQRFSDQEPHLFSVIAAQAAKRQIFRALFNRFPVNYFWFRDDYSIDHVVRNQEIRRNGGILLGVNHGLPRVTYFHSWREIDADIYFSFGTHLYERYYKDAWPPHLRLVSIGNPRLRLEAFQLDPKRNQDIAVFPMVTRWNTRFVREAMALARAFPDRIVYFKMKPDRNALEIDDFRGEAQHAPDNFIWQEGDAYELLRCVSYAVACGSTLGTEALQFGVASFVIDLEPTEANFLYRDFPEMCVKDANEIVSRIGAIEDGSRPYCFDAMKDLIELPPKDITVAIRDAMMPERANHEAGVPEVSIA